MSPVEIPDPILNSPYEEPAEHWHIRPGEPAEKRSGRRPAGYYFRDPRAQENSDQPGSHGQWFELDLVNRIRAQVKEWHRQHWPGVTRTTLELLEYWRREGRKHPLFFAQLEAAESLIFLVEARGDFRQGLQVPLDEPSDERKADGCQAFRRYACKMATGSGKTTVMGMLAAWSILNKVNDRGDARFSDAVLILCPNVTIRDRLRELDPERGEASLYRLRDLVPAHLMTDLSQGKVLVTNWHIFEPQGVQTGGVSARVNKAGVPLRTVESIRIGTKTTTMRGMRYLTLDEYQRQVAAGLLKVLDEEKDLQGHLVKAKVESVRHIESDTALLHRVLGREIGGKQNLLVFNDEAHHAYRIRRPEPEEGEEEEEGSEEFFKEATIWIDGLDRVHKHRGINACVDFSATPYFLGRVGQDANRIFPWTVSDFGLTDAIEAGLVKIPQLVVRDTSGKEVPGYFNIWKWILEEKLTPSERGGKRSSPKPEAILKWAHSPIAILAGLWEELRREWTASKGDPRPPVFIVVCKNTKIAQLLYEWLAEENPPVGIPPSGIAGFRNSQDKTYTIRVDSKVVNETDTGEAKNDEVRWMRFTLDTVGRTDWPRDSQGRGICPTGFEDLAKKLGRPIHPPGRDVRCIVSVGMLTEGWDCNTVTHIIGLRPFMSQLLCEQVVGRGLRRTNYEVAENGRLTEEVAKVFGVPFEVIPFKQNQGAAPPKPKRNHIYAVPEKRKLQIRFPRVEGYQQAIRNKVMVDWNSVPVMTLDPMKIPPEAQVKAGLQINQGRPSLLGPGKLEKVDLNPYRSGRRIQELEFELARDLTRSYVDQPGCEIPAHVLFPQVLQLVGRYLKEKVRPVKPALLLDVFLSPYYGWAIERLTAAIRPDTSAGEIPEVPRYETRRGPGSTGEVDFWTSRDVREVINSHLNYVVADTKAWEQQAAYIIDTHPAVDAFVKNSGLGFSIPYIDNGEAHDYIPDFILRLKGAPEAHLILETKGHDDLAQVKVEAAQRWVRAVNAEGTYGYWQYAIAYSPREVAKLISKAASCLPKPEAAGTS